MPNIEIINPIDYPGWDDLILSTQDYSFFHSSSWARVLSESYGYKPIYFTIFDETRLLGLIPIMEIKSILTGRRGVSLPFSDYCEPIISVDSHFKIVLRHIIRYGKRSGWKYFELRGGKRFFQAISASSYYCYSHTLELKQNEEKVFSCFRDSTRRNIKKAAKQGVGVNISNSLHSVKEFSRLNSITRKRHGLPPQPFYFFKNLYDHVISKNKGIVVLASYNNRIIAAAIYFHLGERVIYKYGASDRAYQHLRPNNLVMWEAIKCHAQKGYKHFSFGRTDPENRGLLQFKDGWGTEKKIVNYYTYDLEKKSFAKEKSGYYALRHHILKKMPICVLNSIGTLLYRHMA